MTYETNNRGTLGKNHRREKDTHPEYSGKCEIDGKMFWISAWIKEGQGEKFFSLSFKPQEAQRSAPAPAPAPRQAAPAPRASGGFEDMDDSIPFSDPLKSRAFCLAV